MAEQEGVIKFSFEFQKRENVPEVPWEVQAWRDLFVRYELIGQLPGRYDGFGFGNLSCRVGAAFSITATQTGGLKCLEDSDYALVDDWSLARNHLSASGVKEPSSESLTHAAIYDSDPEVQFVFHVHSPAIWQARQQLRLPETSAEIPYGTVLMAQTLKSLARELGPDGIIAMAGHEDGIISWSTTAVGAGSLIFKALHQQMS